MFDLLKRGTKDRVPSATGLQSFGRLGSIGFHPSLDPTTKLLCIRSIWTTVGRTLGLKGFKALNPVRIDKPIKSSPCYVYQFHLSAFVRYIIATQLPDTPHRCQNFPRNEIVNWRSAFSKPTKLGWNDEERRGAVGSQSVRVSRPQTLSGRRSRIGGGCSTPGSRVHDEGPSTRNKLGTLMSHQS
jgi:hypothetical protein